MTAAMQAWRAADARSRLRKTLLAAQADDGGWPYYHGRTSRIEPTCWALLALSVERGVAPQVIDRARAFLRAAQRADGLLVEAGTPAPNFMFNGLALLADAAWERPGGLSRDRLADALLHVKGIALEQDANSPIRQNNRLQAWSWIDGTFSWIEPTSMCALALKKTGTAGPVARTRLAEAEAVLLDRVCDGGGWNYGNANVLGQDLRPYVPTTALALLAMQDRRETPAVASSLAWLGAHATSEPATMALSLATVALEAYGAPAKAARDALLAHAPATEEFGNWHLVGLALFALTSAEHGARALKLA